MSNSIGFKSYCLWEEKIGAKKRRQLIIDKALTVLEKKKIKDSELSILICGEKKARKINWQFRKMDYIPQVLAFPMSGEKNEKGQKLLGDVLICWPKVEEEKKKYSKSEDVIIGEWLDHGISNLFK